MENRSKYLVEQCSGHEKDLPNFTKGLLLGGVDEGLGQDGARGSR